MTLNMYPAGVNLLPGEGPELEQPCRWCEQEEACSYYDGIGDLCARCGDNQDSLTYNDDVAELVRIVRRHLDATSPVVRLELAGIVGRFPARKGAH